MIAAKALVVLSGGQDSTTCLFWAKNNFEEVHAITFDYCQRHSLEIEAAQKIAQLAEVTSHEIISLGPVLKGTSGLVNPDQEIGRYESTEALPGGVEPTFVAGRNILFLTIAGNRAFVLGIKDIVAGLCEEDYGGYPDCRELFVAHMQQTLGLGISDNDSQFWIHCPLMHLNKSESVIMASRIPGCLDAMTYSHTCYNGLFPPCGECHACLLRARGFTEAGIRDPIKDRVESYLIVD